MKATGLVKGRGSVVASASDLVELDLAELDLVVMDLVLVEMNHQCPSI